MSKFEAVKKHIHENRGKYCLAAGVAIGVTACGIYISKSGVNIRNSSVKGDVIVNSQVTKLVRRGHPGFKVQINETGETFASIRRLAETLEVDPKKIRQHLKGDIDNVSGFTITKLGEMV